MDTHTSQIFSWKTAGIHPPNWLHSPESRILSQSCCCCLFAVVPISLSAALLVLWTELGLKGCYFTEPHIVLLLPSFPQTTPQTNKPKKPQSTNQPTKNPQQNKQKIQLKQNKKTPKLKPNPQTNKKKKKRNSKKATKKSTKKPPKHKKQPNSTPFSLQVPPSCFWEVD